ncbi:spindle and kinetochore-associated protein 2 isoform X2 [Syngnathus scovelli]|uniref:spindle and kinetochore-associated protein 2 isoform X2 n=1 Tax=Syngnathus scovelli TaxID=161590 RepID=UPI0035CACFEF
MEETVKNLEAMENSLVMLDRLRGIKDKHHSLYSQMTEIAAAQKVSMVSIQDNLNSIIALIQHFQWTTGVEVHCMAQSVQQLKQLLVNNVGETTPESTYGVSPLPLIQKGDPLNGHTQRKGQPPCWKSSASNLFNKPTSGNFESYGGI